jgi:8-oxo-dGTP pyrophosphatase MutT (NUDIX family)
VSERQRGPAEAPNLGEPSAPRPAASVVLMRGGGRHDDRSLEVLLLKRTESARFMPGVWVFPGGSVDPSDGESRAGYEACALRELEEEAGISLADGAELVLFSRWITPEVISSRFDAWFFLAIVPPHSTPRPDGVETVEARWFAPRAALEAQREGELALAFPTIRQLQSLLDFGSCEEALRAHRGRRVQAILPKVVVGADGHRVLLPGNPDYPA